MMLAMHMANELLTPTVAVFFIALAAVILAFASWRTRATFDPAKVPLMGVLGAFIFAAQMINFPILPGTSGHLGGGVLLAILLGPHAATLVMASILIVQCLIFQDGGLLALGTNIFNMGVIPCYLGYAIFRILTGPAPKAGRIYIAILVAAVVGITAGAAMVPIEAWLSGVVAVPLAKFLLAMIGLHLIIALIEAVITFGVVGYVTKVRPQLLGAVAHKLRSASIGLSTGMVAASLFIVALFLGAVISLFASRFPDALESITSVEDAPDQALIRANEDQTIAKVSRLQERTAPLPDYEWTSFSGAVGTLATLVVVWVIGRSLRRRRHRADASSFG